MKKKTIIPTNKKKTNNLKRLTVRMPITNNLKRLTVHMPILRGKSECLRSKQTQALENASSIICLFADVSGRNEDTIYI